MDEISQKLEALKKQTAQQVVEKYYESIRRSRERKVSFETICQTLVESIPGLRMTVKTLRKYYGEEFRKHNPDYVPKKSPRKKAQEAKNAGIAD